MTEPPKDTVPFGFRDVSEAEKPRLVKGVFDSVADRYDVMNDAMSLGIHRVWKDMFVNMLNPQPGWRILDIAGGTGDIAFRMARHANKKGGPADITVCDINAEMLNKGRSRKEALALPEISWACVDAENLPMPDNCADAYTVSYGIRNMTHMDRVLAEAYRVLKPGGRFLCLEFSRVTAPVLDVLFEKYSFAVMPRLGKMITGDGEAYRYLAESIRRFPAQEPYARMIRKAGFSQVSVRNLLVGISAIHSGWKV
jgi:ubiquinone/menaquinone biosynthesis methyltransferase